MVETGPAELIFISLFFFFSCPVFLIEVGEFALNQVRQYASLIR